MPGLVSCSEKNRQARRKRQLGFITNILVAKVNIKMLKGKIFPINIMKNGNRKIKVGPYTV